ncbi:MAG: FHA domain-containing protein [Lachnospiraceae bacterium]|nr:FHA domain-containing protein [Lachnospiraceae bacterium]
MKKIDLEVTKQNNLDVVRYELKGADVYDDRVADKVNQIASIVAFQYSDEDGKRSITSYVKEGTSLQLMFKKTLDKKTVLAIMSGLASAFEIGAQGVPVGYIVRDTNYIYVNEKNLTVKCILLPIKQDVMPMSELPKLFREVLSNIRYDESDKDNYAAKLITLVNSDDFSVAKLKELANSQLEQMGYFVSKDNGLTDMSAGKAPVMNNDIKVNKIGVMNNMMGQSGPMPGAPAPMPGQPPMMGQPGMMPGRPAPMPGQPPMMGQPGAMPGRPAPMPGQPPMMGQPGAMPGRPAPMPGQPPMMGQPGAMPGRLAPMPGQPPMMGQPGMMPGRPAPMPGQPPMMGQSGMMPGAPAPMPGQPPMMGQPGMMPGAPAPMPGQPPMMGQPGPMPGAPAPIPVPTPDPIKEEEKPEEKVEEKVEEKIEEKVEEKAELKAEDKPETPTPVAPTPVAPVMPTMATPTPVAPTPVVPAPAAPTPVAPTPVAPTPVAPAPAAPTVPSPAPVQEAKPGEFTMGALAGQLGSKPVPHIIRKNTGEAINITKPEFSIGKSKTKADYAIENNSAISRVHCIIVQRDGVNYIKDNNSTNHTYVNGVELEPGKEVLLKNKTVIQLGDEEFTFLLRKGE